MKRVLIVDDEKSFLLSLKDGLSVHNQSYELLTAENGREAVTVLRALPIDLLVTDLKLPEMDGFELLAWVSRYQPQLPVIVMTAFGTPEIEARLARMDALQYLEKPLDLQMLQEGIATALKAERKSYIRGITLATFLQLMCVERKSCTLKVRSAGRTGYLYVRRGELVDAENGEMAGEAAALAIVAWDDAEIEMEALCRRPMSGISLPLEHLLIEAFRLKDEKARQEAAALPSRSVPTRDDSVMEPSDDFGRGGRHRRQALETQKGTSVAPSSGRLGEILRKLVPVEEFAVFAPDGSLEEKNAGRCSLDEVDPATLFHLGAMIEESLNVGSLNCLCLNSASRKPCLLFATPTSRVLTRLKPGGQPQQVLREIKAFVNPKKRRAQGGQQ